MSLHKRSRTSRGRRNSEKNQEVASAPRKVKKKKGCFGRMRSWVVRLLLILLVAIIAIPVIVYATAPKYYRVLVIGSDQRDTERARSDVLMVVNVPKNSSDPVSMTMIPRDTKIEHPEKGLEKITHFYAMWEDDEYLGNKELTQEVVEDLLGVKMHGTVEVTFDSFIEIVDMVGGVDTSQGHLDGADAKEIVHNRFVQAEGDFGRAANQREILRNIMSRMRNPVNVQNVMDYFQETERARLDINKTGLALFGFSYVIGHKGNVSIGEVEEVVLPGVGQRIYTPDFGKELYYWVLDEEGVEELVEEYMK